MEINTTYYERCSATLDKAFGLLQNAETESIDYEMYRSACIKEFEIILEQSGKLLRKILRPYLHSAVAADRMYFKDLFKHAVLRSILTPEAGERWLEYRDNRNNTAHDYGVDFAEETLILLPQFIINSSDLARIIKVQSDAS